MQDIVYEYSFSMTILHICVEAGKKTFLKKCVGKCEEVLIREVSEELCKWCISKTKFYVQHTIDRGREDYKNTHDTSV